MFRKPQVNNKRRQPVTSAEDLQVDALQTGLYYPDIQEQSDEFSHLNAPSMETLPPPMIICLDFDLTLTREHTNQRLASTSSRERRHHLISSIKPAENESIKWRDVITSLMEQNHYVVITTYSTFIEEIAFYLEKVIGIESNLLEHIPIFGGVPSEDDGQPLDPGDWDDIGKQQHIQRAIEYCNKYGRLFYENIPSKNIILIDDDALNCKQAKKNGHLSFNTMKGSTENAEEVREYLEENTLLPKLNSSPKPSRP